MSSPNPSLSVVMPAFNEADRLYGNLLITDDVLRSMGGSYEIILVDDGSADRTHAEALRAAAERPQIHVERLDCNQGKGYALRYGAERSCGDLIVFLDADLDLDPRQLGGLIDLMQRHQAGVVIGSKHHPDSTLNYPLRRRIISLGYKFLLMILFRLPVEDTQTGLKVFRREVLQRVYPRAQAKRFASDVEILAVAHRLGYRILEAPVVLDFQRPQRWGNIHFRDIVRTAIETFAIFYRVFIVRQYDSAADTIAEPRGLRTMAIGANKKWAALVRLTSSRLARVAALLFGASMLSNVANYLFQMYASRRLSAGDFGALNALLSGLLVSSVGGGILQQVLARYSSKFTAEGRARFVPVLLRRMLAAVGGVGALSLAALFFAAPVIQAYFRLDSSQPVILVGLTLVVGLAANACTGVLLGTERFGWCSVLGSSGVARLVVGLVLIDLGWGVLGGIAASLLATLAMLLLALVALRGMLPKERGLSLPPDAKVPRYITPVFIALASFTVLNSIDVILARHYLSALDAGYYAAASVLGKITLYLPSSVVLALFPMVSVAETHRDETRTLLVRALMLTALGSLTVAAVFVVLPELALQLLLGGRFVPAAGLLRLYGLAMVPLAFMNLLMNFNLARHEVGFTYALIPVAIGQFAAIALWHGSGVQLVEITMMATMAGFVVTAASVRTRPIAALELVGVRPTLEAQHL